MTGTATIFNVPIFGDQGLPGEVAASMITLTGQYVQNLSTVAAGIFAPSITPYFPTVNTPPVLITAPDPSLISVGWTTPAQPAVFSGVLNIGNYLPGPLTATPPTLSFGQAPAALTVTAPAAPAIDTNFAYPTPSVTLPGVPTLLSLKDLQFNPLAVPTFNEQEPTLNILAPTPIVFNEPSFYTSTTLSDVEASLQSAMTSDTDIGLTAATQQAMWDAAREREYRQQADALAELERMEALGYAFPPGVFIDARLKVQTETSYTIAGLSRDIMIKQAELRLENVTKARELAISLEGQLITYYNAQAQRAFEATKYVTEAQIATYNAQVQAFAARVEAYKASIQAFEAAMRGIEVYVEQLKAQVAFEQAKAEINSALVNQYKTEVDAMVATLEVYKVQVEIIQTEAQVERLKVDIYNAQIQAFVGQVNAYTAQVEGYKANIEAQGAIEAVYKTQVDAYAAEVQAGVAEAQAVVAGYEGQVRAYEAQLEGYKASLQAMVEQARAAMEYNTSAVEAYKGKVQAITSYNTVLTQQWEAVLNEQEKIAEIGVKAAEANGQLYIAARQLSIDAAKVGAQVAAQLGAAALNAIHFSNTSSWATSSSEVASVGTSTSTNTNTNYNTNT